MTITYLKKAKELMAQAGVKGYEVDTDTYVTLEAEEIDALKLESKKTIDLVQFVERLRATITAPPCTNMGCTRSTAFSMNNFQLPW